MLGQKNQTRHSFSLAKRLNEVRNDRQEDITKSVLHTDLRWRASLCGLHLMSNYVAPFEIVGEMTISYAQLARRMLIVKCEVTSVETTRECQMRAYNTVCSLNQRPQVKCFLSREK